ncbi:MAG: DUF447 domain-containing protein [Planctomycetota bacterium]|nr:DUF447 domain-containing protein [Planctomycetota bacterium]
MILESIVTSIDSKGCVNIAPMGPSIDWDLTTTDPIDQTICLRPFQSSRTYSNLLATGLAVVHVTDNAELFTKAAVDAIEPSEVSDLIEPLESTPWWTLRDCHRWFAVQIESIDDSQPRTVMSARIARSAVVRPFFGFNRGKHAVIEAAILATRTHLMDEAEINSQLDYLQPLVDKTGGPLETAAFEFLRRKIDARFCRQ